MTFAQRRNRLATHFSESIPVGKRRMTVYISAAAANDDDDDDDDDDDKQHPVHTAHMATAQQQF
jgi:hypothetical protein